MSGDEKSEPREGAMDRAGWVRVERKVRPYAGRRMNRAQNAGTLGGGGRRGLNAGPTGPSAQDWKRTEDREPGRA